MPRESYATFEVMLSRRFLRAGGTVAWAVVLCLILSTSLRGQERVRSAAPPPLIEAFRRSPDAFFYFGPFQEVLTGSIGVQYTDNVNLTRTDKISDLSFTLGMGLNTTWVISHFNQLEFDFGGQIIDHFYGNGRNQINFAIAPNSKVQFKFAVADLQVRLYDAFSYEQNPTTDPAATNTANLNSLTNTIGAVVDDDLNFAVLSLSGDYTYNNQSGTDVQGQNNAGTSGSRETYRVGSAIKFQWTPTILYGLNAQATRSTGLHEANVNSLNLGPLISGKLSREFEFDLAAGLTVVDTKPSIPPGYYFAVSARYQINRHWQVIFSGSHDLVFNAGTGLTEQNLFRLATQLNVTRFTTLSVSPFVNFGDVKSNSQNTVNPLPLGDYTQFGIEAGLAWHFRKRLSASLAYDYIRRESGSGAAVSGSVSDSYIQNTITFRISYGF